MTDHYELSDEFLAAVVNLTGGSVVNYILIQRMAKLKTKDGVDHFFNLAARSPRIHTSCCN
jgi:hypothetical protein